MSDDCSDSDEDGDENYEEEDDDDESCSGETELEEAWQLIADSEITAGVGNPNLHSDLNLNINPNSHDQVDNQSIVQYEDVHEDSEEEEKQGIEDDEDSHPSPELPR